MTELKWIPATKKVPPIGHRILIAKPGWIEPQIAYFWGQTFEYYKHDVIEKLDMDENEILWLPIPEIPEEDDR